MGLSSFRLNVVLRVLILAGLCFVLFWGLLNTQWVVTPLVTIGLIVMSVLDLIRYVERTSRDLSNFLTVIANHDFSTPVSIPAKGSVFAQLQDAYRLLTGEFRRLNQQKAANHQYLEAIVEHVGVALLCFDEHGEVKLMNAPARRLFGVPYLANRRSFGRLEPRLPEILQTLADGERTMVDIHGGDDSLRLVLYATTFEMQRRRYQIVSFHNIRDELDHQEVESWQKLIRVLTHEIMNSVTPIISLSGLVRETMIDETTTPPTVRALLPQQQNDMLRSVTAIHTRSRGLMDFVGAYRSFSKLPEPAFASVDIRPLLERVRVLMSQDMNTHGIALELQCPDDALSVGVDADQIEQVLINLIRNAIEALMGGSEPRIVLRALRNPQNEILVQVIDNGTGIPAEHLDSIFVPFFTTKRNGTGVGLSVSRQIVQLNRGLISVRSVPGDGCVFTLKFPESVPSLP